jgi:hypothetical protein
LEAPPKLEANEIQRSTGQSFAGSLMLITAVRR